MSLANFAVAPQSGYLIAASVTATTAATAITVLTLARKTYEVRCTSDLNAGVQITVGGLDFQYMPAGSGASSNPVHGYFAEGTVFGAYQVGSPTAGRVYVQTT